MAILSWGKCKLEYTTSVDGAPAPEGPWTELDIPKEDTTQLAATAGTETTATEEGGDVVDVIYGRNSYEFSFDLFVKKGKERPFEDNDGVVAGEHAFRLTPEDEECEGIQIDRCKIRVEENFNTKDGILLHHVCKCLKPKTGNTIKPYTKEA